MVTNSISLMTATTSRMRRNIFSRDSSTYPKLLAYTALSSPLKLLTCSLGITVLLMFRLPMLGALFSTTMFKI